MTTVTPQPVKRPTVRAQASSHALGSLRQAENKSVGQLANQMLADPIVRVADWTLRTYIASAETQVVVTGGDQRGRILQGALQNLWQNHVYEMLNCISHGRSAFEQVKDYNEKLNLSYVKKLEYLPYEYTEMDISKDGHFEGITLKKSRIPKQDSWWLALNPTAIRPQGVSMMEGAPEEVWKERQATVCLRKSAVRRIVIDGGVWAIPFDSEIEDGQLIDEATAFGAAWDSKLSGGVMLVSNKVDRTTQEPLYRMLMPPAVIDIKPISDIVDILNNEYLLAMCVPPSSVLQSEVGSFAKASSQLTVLYAVCDYILGQCQRSFKQYVAVPCVASNFGENSGVSVTVSHEALSKKNNVQAGQLPNDPANNPIVPIQLDKDGKPVPPQVPPQNGQQPQVTTQKSIVPTPKTIPFPMRSSGS